MKGQGIGIAKRGKLPVVKFSTSGIAARFRASLAEDHWVVCQTRSGEKCAKWNLDQNHNHMSIYQRYNNIIIGCFQIKPFFGYSTWPPRPRSMAELPKGYRPPPKKQVFSYWEIQSQNSKTRWTTKKTTTRYNLTWLAIGDVELQSRVEIIKRTTDKGTKAWKIQEIQCHLTCNKQRWVTVKSGEKQKYKVQKREIQKYNFTWLAIDDVELQSRVERETQEPSSSV